MTWTGLNQSEDHDSQRMEAIILFVRSDRMVGGKGRVTEDDGSFDREFWRNATPEEKVAAIFELRDLYYEVMHPGAGAEGLDRSIGGTRRLRD